MKKKDFFVFRTVMEKITNNGSDIDLVITIDSEKKIAILVFQSYINYLLSNIDIKKSLENLFADSVLYINKLLYAVNNDKDSGTDIFITAKIGSNFYTVNKTPNGKASLYPGSVKIGKYPVIYPLFSKIKI